MAERDPSLAGDRAHSTYKQDYAAWLEAQLGFLRNRRFEKLDLENLLDEVNDLGLSNFKAFVSAVEIVLIHMLKWDFQPERRARSWKLSIIEHRQRIADELQDSPSYNRRLAQAVDRAYRTAVPATARETGLALDKFPASCPYEWDEIVSREHDLD